MATKKYLHSVLAATIATSSALSIAAVPGVGQVELGLELARQLELDQLEFRIGRFTSAEAAVYAGTLEATDGGSGRAVRTLSRGRVVAALEEQERSPGAGAPGVTLTVVSAQHGLWLRLGQSAGEPGVTRVTRLRPLHGSPGITASCSGCLADLRNRPGTIRLDRFVASGRLRDVRGSEFRVELRGHLEWVPPAELALDDLERLNPGLEPFLRDEAEGFTRRGGEGVRRVERQLRRHAPSHRDAPSETRCERVTHYSAERFVDLADLSRFGVRDVRILGTEICCLDHDGHGHAEQCSEEGSG